MGDWEFEQVKLAAARDSWEDEEVADSWDAEEEEEEVEVVVKKVVEAVKKAAPVPAPKKAPVFEEPEESEQARKERMNRLIQESDLENAMALFGISKSEINVDEVLEITKKEVKKVAAGAGSDAQSGEVGGYFENAKPQSWSEFEALSVAISKKLKSLDTSKHYPNFLETLFRALLQDRDVPEIRKLSNMTAELITAKQKDKLAQLGNKKKPAPSLAGAKKSGRADMMDDFSGDDDYDGF